MKFALAILIFVIWLFFAPWIAIGYGEPGWPTIKTNQLFDVVFFYTLPVVSVAVAISAYRSRARQ